VAGDLLAPSATDRESPAETYHGSCHFEAEIDLASDEELAAARSIIATAATMPGSSRPR
jgi:hypothetical protein